MATVITSTHNPRIKHVLQLSKSSSRKDENLFVIEGLREIKKASATGYHFEAVYYCPDIMNEESLAFLSQLSPQTERIEVIKHVYERMAYRNNRDGLIIEAVPKYPEPEELKLSDNPLIFVLESVEKPGNLGAIFRTADAADVDAVLICDSQTDIYNPNIIRSSLGCLFTTPFAISTPSRIIEFLKEKGILVISAALQTSMIYSDLDLRKPSAIVLGSEAEGLTEIWRTHSDFTVKIPMAGMADSLNVSVTAGILVFEALRQRSLRK